MLPYRLPAKILLSIFVFIMYTGTLKAQNNFYFEKITSPGLLTPITRAVATDDSGYVYIGTNDGLYKYDGYAFEKYPVTGPDSLSCPVHNIRNVHFDGTNIWVGGVEGLAKLNPVTGKFKYFKPVAAEVEAGNRPLVTRIKQIGGNIFMGTYRSVTVIDIATDKITELPLPETAKSLYTYGFCRDKNGKVWVGTAHDGIYIYNPQKGSLQPAGNYFKNFIQLPQQNIFSLMEADNETIWAGTKQGLFSINTSTGEWKPIDLYNEQGTKVFPEIRKIIKDKNNNCYIATVNNGLFFYNGRSGIFYNYTYNERWNNSLPDNHINDIAEGTNGVFWLTTEDAGLSKLNTWYSRYTYTIVPPFSSEKNLVTVTDVQKKGTDTWLATSEGLVKYTQDKQFILFNPEKQNITSKYLQFLHVLDDDHLVFLAYDDGVCVFNVTNSAFGYLQPPGKTIPGNKMIFDWLSFADKSGNYYMSTDKGGFFRCNYTAGTTDTLFTSNNIKLDYPVVVPEPDDNNNLWIIAASELYHYNTYDRKLKHIDHDKNGIELPPVSFQEDVIAAAKGILYIASDEGFFIYNLSSNQLKQFTVKDGLPENNCFSLFTDDKKRPFIVNSRSIVLFNEQDNTFTAYPIPALKSIASTPYFDEEGNLYAGMENAFIKVNSKALSAYNAMPQLTIKQIQTGSSFISHADIVSQKTIKIHYDQFPLIITYQLIDHLNPENNKLRYKLEGWDKDWIADDKKNFKAAYSHLSPGSYTFKTEGTNGFIKPGATLSFAIEIIPPFWQTWWFVLICILLLAAGIYSIYKYRLSQVLKMQAVRNKIASDLHDDVGSTLSSIRMYSDIVKNQPNQTSVAWELLDKISSNSKEMIENMSDIVWMIKPGNDEFKNIENRMLNFANELCVPAAINFEFNKDSSAEDIKLHMEQRRDLYLIFKEAVNNAVKYSGCHFIHTIITRKNNQLEMRISDDGNGFSTAIIKNGNGLTNMQQRTKANGGTFTIQSNPGEGTEITVLFPI